MEFSNSDNWLFDEKLDLPSSDVDILDNFLEESDDEDEVFFGPLTLKEKCIAAAVKEVELKSEIILKPEEQAMLLREAAMVSLRIKQGRTPARSSYPVAVVHPMKKGSDRGETDTTIAMDEEKENMAMNEITHKSSNMENVQSLKLAEPKVLPKARKSLHKSERASQLTQLSTNQQQVDSKVSTPTSSFGGKKVSEIRGNKSLTKKSDRKITPQRSGVSVMAKTSFIPKSKNSLSSLPSAFPRSKPNSAKGLKSTSQPISGLPQPKLKLSARKGVSSGALSDKKILKLKSTQKLTNVQEIQPAVTSMEGKKAIKQLNYKTQALTTPISKVTPSRSIAGRRFQCEKESAIIPRKTVSPFSREDVAEKETNKENICESTISNFASDITPSSCRSESRITCKEMGHNKLMEHDTKNVISVTAEEVESINKQTGDHLLIHQEDPDISSCPESTVVENIEIASKPAESDLTAFPSESVLIDISDDHALSSPVKIADNCINPFETGNTPPHLIEWDNILEPERIGERNLIEF